MVMQEKDYSLKQLQDMARSQGVDTTGTKQNIINRLKKPQDRLPQTKPQCPKCGSAKTYPTTGKQWFCNDCKHRWVPVSQPKLPQTDRGRITGIIKGKEYWPKVNALQKAILDRMNAGTILEVRSDGGLTFEAGGRQYVLTTDGGLSGGKPPYHPDRPGPMPQTIIGDDMLKYYKVPPEAY